MQVVLLYCIYFSIVKKESIIHKRLKYTFYWLLNDTCTIEIYHKQFEEVNKISQNVGSLFHYFFDYSCM